MVSNNRNSAKSYNVEKLLWAHRDGQSFTHDWRRC